MVSQSQACHKQLPDHHTCDGEAASDAVCHSCLLPPPAESHAGRHTWQKNLVALWVDSVNTACGNHLITSTVLFKMILFNFKHLSSIWDKDPPDLDQDKRVTRHSTSVLTSCVSGSVSRPDIWSDVLICWHHTHRNNFMSPVWFGPVVLPGVTSATMELFFKLEEKLYIEKTTCDRLSHDQAWGRTWTATKHYVLTPPKLQCTTHIREQLLVLL